MERFTEAAKKLVLDYKAGVEPPGTTRTQVTSGLVFDKSIGQTIYYWKKSIVKKICRKSKRNPPQNFSVLLKIGCCWKGVFCMVLRENRVLKPSSLTPIFCEPWQSCLPLPLVYSKMRCFFNCLVLDCAATSNFSFDYT